MREVTLTAPSYGELQAIYMAKKIYLPETHNLTKEEENELYNRYLVHNNEKIFKRIQCY